jgi:hypothetical protein
MMDATKSGRWKPYETVFLSLIFLLLNGQNIMPQAPLYYNFCFESCNETGLTSSPFSDIARLMPELQFLAPHPLPASVQCLNNLLRQRTLVQGCQILLKVLRATRANNDGIALLSLQL